MYLGSLRFKNRGGRRFGFAVFRKLLFCLRFFPLQREQKVRRRRSIVGRAEDLVLVLLQCFDPRADICGVLCRVMRYSSLSGEKDTGELGAEFFLRIVNISESV